MNDNYYYVDKTLLVKEFLESSGSVAVIPRPRRFGKTLNISMLRYFFEQSDTNNSHLFTSTAIWQDSYSRNYQGKFPVIFLTFKDVKEISWESTYKKIREVIAREFERHLSFIQEKLTSYQLTEYMAIVTKTADEETYSTSLLLLTQILSQLYNTRVMVFIDEYDAAIHEAYMYGYYAQVVRFFRSLMTSVFKDNSFLERGVLTGILRVAKEGIFSGLNNLKVYSITHNQFQDKFGFTQGEVKQLLKDQKLSDKLSDVQVWYNGYLCGSTTIYNPWSLLMCVDERGLLQPYWANTSNNELVKKFIALADEGIKKDLELLLSGKTIEKEIDEAIIFLGIEHNPTALWSLLLFTGYLTYTKQELNEEGAKICTLIIPNQEIKILYKSLIKNIFENTLTVPKAQALLAALTTGDTASFAELLQEFVSSSMNVYDLPSNEPEKSYHLFVLGLLVLLSDNYEIKSNRESGLGRYDIMLIPKKSNTLALILEFKKIAAQTHETLEQAAQRALKQIKEKQYVQELKDRNIKTIKLFGIAFLGKQLFVAAEEVS